MSKPITNINIRLYNTGSVGDCILIRFYNRSTLQFSLMIDCGGWNAPTEQITACVEDIKSVTGGHIHLLVVTHQHLDHVSGFNQAKSVFDTMQIDRVWMSWIEDETDEIGMKLRELYGKRVAELKAATGKALKAIEQQSRFKFKTRNAGKNLGLRRNAMQNTLDLLEFEEGITHGMRGAAARRTNDDAMAYVKGLVDNPEYRIPGEVLRNLPGIEGIKFFILGPPRDADMKYFKIAMEEEEMYHLKAGAEKEPASDIPARVNGILSSGILLEEGKSPFEARYHLNAAGKKKFFAEYKGAELNWRQIETDWLESAAAIAMRVTSLTNNTSLAMAIEIESTGQVILLPGDAQSGNWMGWHKPEVMDALKKKGGKTTEDLLRDTVLYKVGHHGSHNGTASRSGLEKMTHANLVALMPLVQSMVPAAWGGADNFPDPALYEQLIKKTKGRLLRTDEGIIKSASAAKQRTKLPATEKRRFSESVEHTDNYIGYNLKVR